MTSSRRVSGPTCEEGPFTKSIKESLMSKRFHIPNDLEVYNGIGYPDAFVKKNKRTLELKGVDEVGGFLQMLRSSP